MLKMSKVNNLLKMLLCWALLASATLAQKAHPPRPRPSRAPVSPSPDATTKATPPELPDLRKSMPTADATARNAALLDATAQVLAETSTLRQLSVMRPVPSGTQSRAEIEKNLTAELDRVTDALHTDEILYRQMGLVAPDFQLRPFLLELLTEQVAGYYDIRAGRFYVADWIGLDKQKPVMAHELTHALQDQHFNLHRFLDVPLATDKQLAINSVVEGDALLVMQQYIQSNPLRLLNANRAGQMPAMTPTFDRAPRIVRETLTFPYQAGLVWAAQVYQRGGWAAVSQAYQDLPQSSTHILHPETYFARLAPVAVELPDASKQLGANWQRVGYDVRGEWQYFLLLDSWLKDESLSRSAAMGWRGDRCAVYENPRTGQTLVAQSVVLATEKDAQEFQQAWTRRNNLHYQAAEQTINVQATPAPNAPPQPEITSQTAQDVAQTLPLVSLAWTTPTGTAWLFRRGPQVWLVTCAPLAWPRAKVAALVGLTA